MISFGTAQGECFFGVKQEDCHFNRFCCSSCIGFGHNEPKQQAPFLENKELIQENKYGIYALDLENQETELIYSLDHKISKIRLNNVGDKLVFAMDLATK